MVNNNRKHPVKPVAVTSVAATPLKACAGVVARNEILEGLVEVARETPNNAAAVVSKVASMLLAGTLHEKEAMIADDCSFSEPVER
jgi:D-arabinose 5-phosphate isomerase GutQ